MRQHGRSVKPARYSCPCIISLKGDLRGQRIALNGSIFSSRNIDAWKLSWNNCVVHCNSNLLHCKYREAIKLCRGLRAAYRLEKSCESLSLDVLPVGTEDLPSVSSTFRELTSIHHSFVRLGMISHIQLLCFGYKQC